MILLFSGFETDGEANVRAICAKRKHLNRMEDAQTDPEAKGVNWGQEDGHRYNHTADLRHR